MRSRGLTDPLIASYEFWLQSAHRTVSRRVAVGACPRACIRLVRDIGVIDEAGPEPKEPVGSRNSSKPVGAVAVLGLDLGREKTVERGRHRSRRPVSEQCRQLIADLLSR